MKHIRLLFLGALLISGSCSKENSFQPEEVKLLVSIEGTEKSRVNLDGNKFEGGDQFAFFFEQDKPISDPLAPLYQYDGSAWSTEKPTYWDDQEDNVDRYFCAIMPFDNYTVDTHSFNVIADQTDAVDYKKNDLLIARVYTNKRLIPIRFYHALSRVIVKVTASTNTDNVNGYFDISDFNGMTVTLNNAILTATVDYTTTPTQNDEKYNPMIGIGTTGSAEQVTMYSTGSNPVANNTTKTVTSTFYAIVPPQTISDQPLLTITIKVGETDKTYYFKAERDVTFKQGKATTINLTLDKSKVELSGAENAIQISDWNDISANDENPIQLQ